MGWGSADAGPQRLLRGTKNVTKNYIFDFGRVLVDFDPLSITKYHISNEADARLVSEVVFDRLYWSRLDDGTITDDQVKRLACARLPERLRQGACAVYDNWYCHLPPIAGMEPLLARLKESGCGLYLLSNISIGFAEGWRSVPGLERLFSRFDGLVFSGPLHLVKPEPEIFRYLLETYGLSAEDCTFIDDSAANIAGAQALGIGAVLFEGSAAQLENRIFG